MRERADVEVGEAEEPPIFRFFVCGEYNPLPGGKGIRTVRFFASGRKMKKMDLL